MQTISVENALPVPWYRVGVMWVFVGGLGAVVIGSFMLLATAIVHADKVLPSTPMKPPSYFKTAVPDASKPTP